MYAKPTIDYVPTASYEPITQEQAPQQSLVPQPAPIKMNKQETSPTPADIEFTKPKKNAKTLLLPSDWTKENLDKAKAIGQKYGMSLQETFGIMGHETGDTYSPKTKNSIGATGLIQFIPSTSADLMLRLRQEKAVKAVRSEAKAQELTPAEEEARVALARRSNPLLWQLSPEKRKEAAQVAQRSVERMDINQQLELKDKYLEERTRGKKGVDNVYTAIFAGNPGMKVMERGTRAYENNKALDRDGNGFITREEWLRPVKNRAENIREVAINNARPMPATMPVDLDSSQRITEADKEALINDAINQVSLANPEIPMKTIRQRAMEVPIELTYPGTPEQEYLKTAGLDRKPAGGLYWGKETKGPERIQVTSSLPRPAAVGVMAHELGHALGKKEGNIPNELQYYDGQQFLERGRQAAVSGAFKEGARKLDQEQAIEEQRVKAKNFSELKSMVPWLPDSLVEAILPDMTPSKPSSSASLERIKQQNGEAEADYKTWEKEQSYPAKKKKKK
jgi:hypothetical protein